MKKRIYRMLTAVILLALLLPAMAAGEDNALDEDILSEALEPEAIEQEAFMLGESEDDAQLTDDTIPAEGGTETEEDAQSAPETVPEIDEAEDDLIIKAPEVMVESESAAMEMAAADVPTPRELVATVGTKAVSTSMNNIDTLKITSESAGISKVTCSQKKIVSVTFDGTTITVKPVANASGKATVKLKLDNKKSVKVSINVVDPYEVTKMAFSAKTYDLAPGKTLDLAPMLIVEPAYANQNLTWKISGSAAKLKDGVVTAVKKGSATVTVTSSGKKKKKATIKINVPDNKVKSLGAKPTKANAAQVRGGWTLWPYSIEATSKGTLKAQFYLINGTDEKSVRLENLKLTVIGGTADTVAAEYTFSTVKVAATKGNVKSFKLEFPASACAGLSRVFLPEEYQNGTLYFDLNVEDAVMVTKVKKEEYRYPYITDRLPNRPDKPAQPEQPEQPDAPKTQVQRIELSQSKVVIKKGDKLTLTATVLPENATDRSVTWTSSNNGVAKVENGVVEGLSAGSAEITATAADGSGVKATCSVSVEDAAPAGDYVMENGVVLGYTGSDKKLTIPDKDYSGNPVTAIGDSAFAGNTTITSVNLPASLTQIGAQAFEGCSSLESVNTPNSVTTIGKAAFKNCTKLTAMTTF